jgi:hypothetical protein
MAIDRQTLIDYAETLGVELNRIKELEPLLRGSIHTLNYLLTICDTQTQAPKPELNIGSESTNHTEADVPQGC